MDLHENVVVAERFRLIRELGRGAMGSVWLAHHLALDIPCAIKFVDLPLRGHADVRARLAREARAEAAIRSPHVVQIFDYGTWEEVPYIAMEYLEGESLAARLDRVGRLDPASARRLVTQVAHALHKAHAAGIVHRDLKPENIFLVGDDEGEAAKVFDFGVAQVARGMSAFEGTMSEGHLVGTPLYMSPEQARATGRVDFRSDLWSLAVVAFECLTGRPPFFSDDLKELLRKILHDVPPLPSQLVGDLPLEVDDWWLRASARDPGARFQSAKELAHAFANALRYCTGRGSERMHTVPSARSHCPSLVATRLGQPAPTIAEEPASPSPDALARDSFDGPWPVTTSTEPALVRHRSLLRRSRAWLAEPRRRHAAVGITGVSLVALCALIGVARQSRPLASGASVAIERSAGAAESSASRSTAGGRNLDAAHEERSQPASALSAPIAELWTGNGAQPASGLADPAGSSPGGRTNSLPRDDRPVSGRASAPRPPLTPSKAREPGGREKSNNPQRASPPPSVDSPVSVPVGTSAASPRQVVDFGF